MDEKQMRAEVIRWLNHLVHSCDTCDVEMVADVMGLRSSEELRSMAQHMVHELEERGE